MRKFIPSEGPISWTFKDPDTGYKYYGENKQGLITRILNYREQNKLPHIPALSLTIDNYLCSLPENIHKCEDAKIKRSWMTYLKGGISILTNLWYKSQVEDIIAEERALQCQSCPFNVFPDKGEFVKWSDEIADKSTGGRKVSVHEELGSCEVCTCTLKALVFYGGEFDLAELSEDQKDQMRSVNCWQIKEYNKLKKSNLK